MEIKLFENGDISKLEQQVNDFLKDVDPGWLVDIKYATPVTTEYWAEGERTANEHEYSAMVILKSR